MAERSESSCTEGCSEDESSSSVSGFGRFLDAGAFLGFSVVCDSLVTAAFGTAAFLGTVVAFLGAALGFDFYIKVSKSHSRVIGVIERALYVQQAPVRMHPSPRYRRSIPP